MGEDWLGRLRDLALALPGADERVGERPARFVVGERELCVLDEGGGRGGRVALWVPAPPGAADEVIAAEPTRFFRPPAGNGTRDGWLGVYLDATGPDQVDWNEVEAMLDDAYRTLGAHASAPRHREPLRRRRS